MTVVTCRDCPSFVTADEASDVYAKSPGADSCARHGYILSRGALPDLNTRIVTEYAAKCDDHGKVREKRKILTAQVAIGDPRAMAAGTPAAGDRAAVCTDCQHFVPPSVVAKELGWELGLCAFSGRLIFPNRYTSEAFDCGVGITGRTRDTADGVMLLPVYETKVTVGGKGGPVRAGVTFSLSEEIAKHEVDPREYETDMPVTDLERRANIRAWREVRDPEGKKPPVYVPIFDGPKLYGRDPRDSYGGHRPDLYIDHMGLTYDLACEMLAYDADRNPVSIGSTPLLIGPAGTGKTELAFRWAYLTDLECNRFSVSKGTEDWHFKGQTELVTEDVEIKDADGRVIRVEPTQVTRFKLGRFARCVTQPGVAVVDEPNLNASVFEFFRPITDGAGELRIDDDKGVRVERHPLFMLMMAQNPSDDPIYVGTEPLNAADLSRVSPFRFALPDESTERAIIVRHCKDADYEIDAKTLDKIMQIARDIRTQIKDGKLPIAWGIRDQVKVALKTRHYSIEKAYRRAVIDGLDSAVINSVLGSVRSVA